MAGRPGPILLALLVCVLLFVPSAARGEVVHDFEPGLTEKIAKEAQACAAPPSSRGPGTHAGPFEELTGLTVFEGDLWFAEGDVAEAEGGDLGSVPGGRVDSLVAQTGECVGQLESLPSNSPGSGGIALGAHSGEREVYVGVGGSALVGVFGPAGVLQHVWSGADTPAGSFQASARGGADVTGVAVDEAGLAGGWAAGDVLVAAGAPGGGVVYALEPSAGGGEPSAGGVRELLGTCASVGVACSGSEVVPFRGPAGVAVDRANGEVFVLDGGKPGEYAVDVFAPGVLPGEFVFEGRLAPPGGFPGQVFGVAVDGAARGGAGDVYAWEEGVVYEFDLATGELVGRLTGSSAASPFTNVHSVAVDESSHELFVADHRYYRRGDEYDAIDVFGPDLVVPDVAVSPAGEVSASSAVLQGSVDPDGEGVPECWFEYGTSTSYGSRVDCAQALKKGTSPEPVSQQLEGLSSGTAYYYRVVAKNANGTDYGECPADCGEFRTRGPGVEQSWAAGVTATSATLDAVIDPGGAATSFFFQYGTGSLEERQAPAAPGVSLGAGSVAVRAPAVGLSGLAPDTSYRYRVVAVSEVEVSPHRVEVHYFYGPEGAFTTQGAGAAGLPDSRAYEMVSPPFKQGASLTPLDGSYLNGAPIQAAADGGAFAYLAKTPSEEDVQGNSNEPELLSVRTSAGWQTHDLTVPHEHATNAATGLGNEYRFFNEDLSLAVVQPFGPFDPQISAEASEATAFLHTTFTGGASSGEACDSSCYRPLVTAKPGFANAPAGFGRYGGGEGQVEGQTCPPQLVCGPQFSGASPDGEQVVLASSVALTEAPIPDELKQQSLYEWDGEASGRLALVSVLPEAEGGMPVAPAVLGGAGGGIARGAISQDGSRVFFSVEAGSTSRLYLHDLDTGKTGRLDLPEARCAGCGHAAAEAVFQDATPDGSRVWFLDGQRLTADSGASGGEDPDLYECVVGLEPSGAPFCETLSDLTPASEGRPANARGLIGVGEDGSYVYYVAGAGVYVRHAGKTSFIVAGADIPMFDGAGLGDLPRLTARVSPNGLWLAFMSHQSLTGYDNHDARTGVPDEEVYLYSAAAGRLICASCDPTGARPVGEGYEAGHDLQVAGGGQGTWPPATSLAALIPGWSEYTLGTARYQSRYLSDDGRLFFDARDPLVPQAVNENWDVYEWEPAGVGSCTEGASTYHASTGGCTALISSGEAPGESGFLDASEEGSEVFFMTAAKLAPQDLDSAYDVYDARECTSESPCIAPPPTPPPPCATADACRPAPTPQPSIFGPPASATFTGPANPAPTTTTTTSTTPPAKPRPKTARSCGRGHRRTVHGRCVTIERKRARKASARRRKQ